MGIISPSLSRSPLSGGFYPGSNKNQFYRRKYFSNLKQVFTVRTAWRVMTQCLTKSQTQKSVLKNLLAPISENWGIRHMPRTYLAIKICHFKIFSQSSSISFQKKSKIWKIFLKTLSISHYFQSYKCYQ